MTLVQTLMFSQDDYIALAKAISRGLGSDRGFFTRTITHEIGDVVFEVRVDVSRPMSMEAIDSHNGTTLWADTCEEEVIDVLSVDAGGPDGPIETTISLSYLNSLL